MTYREPDFLPEEPDPYEVARARQQTIVVALRSGCLWGIGLVVLFFAISAVAYVVTGFVDLERSIRLLITFSCGPTVGTGIVLVVYYFRAKQAQREYLANRPFSSQPRPQPDETDPWDSP